MNCWKPQVSDNPSLLGTRTRELEGDTFFRNVGHNFSSDATSYTRWRVFSITPLQEL